MVFVPLTAFNVFPILERFDRNPEHRHIPLESLKGFPLQALKSEPNRKSTRLCVDFLIEVYRLDMIILEFHYLSELPHGMGDFIYEYRECLVEGIRALLELSPLYQMDKSMSDREKDLIQVYGAVKAVIALNRKFTGLAKRSMFYAPGHRDRVMYNLRVVDERIRLNSDAFKLAEEIARGESRSFSEL